MAFDVRLRIAHQIEEGTDPARHSLAYRELSLPKVIWAMGAWLAVSGIAVGRIVGGWQARRAAIYSSLSFAAVIALYVAFRVAETNGGGRFL